MLYGLWVKEMRRKSKKINKGCAEEEKTFAKKHSHTFRALRFKLAAHSQQIIIKSHRWHDKLTKKNSNIGWLSAMEK